MRNSIILRYIILISVLTISQTNFASAVNSCAGLCLNLEFVGMVV